MRRTSKGFTLIELLIVVAIIGILAAIAIPNFLEAQTRAKLASTRSNLRTIAIGLEAYAVDYGDYPNDTTYLRAFYDRLTQLTTPIEYMSAIYPDPYAEKESIIADPYYGSVNPYTDSSGVWSPVLTYDYAKHRDNGVFNPGDWLDIVRNDRPIEWAMRGIGPDRDPSWLGRGVLAYDPTNGTISSGQIYWAGPGWGETGPLNSYQ